LRATTSLLLSDSSVAHVFQGIVFRRQSLKPS